MTMDTMSPAEKKHWDTILCEAGLSMWRGVEQLVYISKDTVLDWIANGAPGDGKILRYEIGNRINHLRVCQRKGCGVRFTSKRQSAKYCSKKCRQRKAMLDERICLVCVTPMQPKHRDARFHPECRYRGYRALLKIDSCASII